MSVNLKKGGRVSLTKEGGAPLRKIVVACGWDVNEKRGEKGYDLDLSAAAVDASGRVPDVRDSTDAQNRQEWFVWANHHHPSGRSITFMGDNRTGEGEGDDEEIKVDLTLVPDHIERIIFAVVIWDAKKRGGQKFGSVQNAFIRIYDEETSEEIVRFDLGAEFSEETLVIFGEVYRRNGEWKFNAVGQGYNAEVYRRDHNIESPFETEFARRNY